MPPTLASIPCPGLGADALLQTLLFVAGLAQPLHVVFRVLSTFSQRNLVIALSGQRQAAMPHALGTQRIATEQLMSELLQLAAGNALGGCWLLSPISTLMFLTSVRSTSNQNTATRVNTGLRC